MTRGSTLRNLMLFAALLLLAFTVATPASAKVDFSVAAFQDFGDDDGDGIPNELDPDDDNDGIVDKEDETPSAPVEEEDTDSGSAPPVEPNPPASGGSMVTSLPETGVGGTVNGYQILAASSAILGAVWSIRNHYSRR